MITELGMHTHADAECWVCADRVKVFVRVRPALWAGETAGALELDENDQQKIIVHRQCAPTSPHLWSPLHS